MEQGKTPMDLYRREVEKPKPQTKKEVEERFKELLSAKDDDFLKGEVHANKSLVSKDSEDRITQASTDKDAFQSKLFQAGDKVHHISDKKRETLMTVMQYDADGKVLCRIESAYSEEELVKCE